MIPPDAADEVVAHRRTQDGHDDATGLSRIEQDDSELTKCIFELYAIQAIERNNDDRFPLDLWFLKTEQLQDEQQSRSDEN